MQTNKQKTRQTRQTNNHTGSECTPCAPPTRTANMSHVIEHSSHTVEVRRASVCVCGRAVSRGGGCGDRGAQTRLQLCGNEVRHGVPAQRKLLSVLQLVVRYRWSARGPRGWVDVETQRGRVSVNQRRTRRFHRHTRGDGQHGQHAPGSHRVSIGHNRQALCVSTVKNNGSNTN